MLTFFKRPFQLRRVKTGGGYDEGGYAIKTQWGEPETLFCNIQPVRADKQNALSLEVHGRAYNRAIILYAEERLNVAGQNTVDGDVISYNGVNYLLCAEQTWDNSLHFSIAHYRYIGLDCWKEDA